MNWENISDKAAEGSLNEAFEEYYKEQGVCPAEEWDAFIATLIKPLPTVFRINGSGRFANALRARLEDDFFSKFTSQRIIVDGTQTYQHAMRTHTWLNRGSQPPLFSSGRCAQLLLFCRAGA